MDAFPIWLDTHFFTYFRVVSNAKHEPDQLAETKPGNSELYVNISPEDDKTLYAHQLVEATSDDISQPYLYEIRCFGKFIVDERIPQEQRIPQVTILAHTILYGAIREALLAATARQAWGPHCLPIAVLDDGDETNDDIVNEKIKSRSIKTKTRLTSSNK